LFSELAGSPLLAESRSPAHAYECLLWRKLPLKPDEPAAIADPTETLGAG